MPSPLPSIAPLAIAPPASITAQLRSIGRTLRSVRSDRSHTVLRQAGRAGLTASVVERIERGDCRASFGEVMALCASLDLLLVALPSETAPGAPVSVRVAPA